MSARLHSDVGVGRVADEQEEVGWQPGHRAEDAVLAADWPAVATTPEIAAPLEGDAGRLVGGGRGRERAVHPLTVGGNLVMVAGGGSEPLDGDPHDEILRGDGGDGPPSRRPAAFRAHLDRHWPRAPDPRPHDRRGGADLGHRHQQARRRGGRPGQQHDQARE